MKNSFDLAVEISEEYDFNSDSLSTIEKNRWVKNQYPLVYFIKNNEAKIAYVGESTNGLSRIKNHLSNPSRRNLNKISIIGSDKFNKSATLDIESKLIQYIQAEGSFELQNGNGGHTLHNYYQQDLYKSIFDEIWIKLLEKNLVSKTLDEIENSSLFKYSPYKSLNADQFDSILAIIEALSSDKSSTIMVDGSAGTGKTILATYLIKLLVSDFSEDPDSLNSEDAIRELNALKKFKARYPKKPEIGFVIAMTSLRETLKKVFKSVPGLKASMVISPSKALKKNYDILIVDESHRLRRYKNISWMGTFRANNQKLGLDDTGDELHWLSASSPNLVLFYDQNQSIKPSDIIKERFDELKKNPETIQLELKSQMRVKAGNDYIAFINNLLDQNTQSLAPIEPDKNYELFIFDSLQTLYKELKIRNDRFGLSRLVAGYSWEWMSDPKRKPKDLSAIDIRIDGLNFQWNRTDKDWVNSNTSFAEIGCIHTTQGYDLNYTGVIFGNEIRLDPKTQQIEIIKDNYYDKYGKNDTNQEDLKAYIINIYKTLMYRGIKGTFVYVCDKHLRDYLKRYIPVYKPFRVIESKNVKPYINSVPVYDLKASAGDFSDFQNPEELEWVELPPNISPQKGMFICQVIGESMNQVIPNGSWCLFKADPGGSRNGLITLVQMMDYTDPDYGSNYTVKEYSSKKTYSGETWEHDEIRLTPKSTEEIEPIVLKKDEMIEWRVVGVFVRVLEHF